MKFKLLILLSCFIGSQSVFSQSHINEIGIQTDNDSYLAQGSDRYYTDGIFIYYNHALHIKNSDSTVLRNKVLGFEIGQKIFNPQSGYVPSRVFVDRPFAGYLYAGVTLNFLFKNESNIKLGAQLGVVGPASQAEQVQTFVHKNFGFYEPGGWQYQIQNEAELNLSAQYNKLLARGSWIDVSLLSYVNLGNGFTGAGLGPLIRAGSFNQLFNSVSTQSTVINQDNASALHPHELFFYYKPLFNYVAYDATIQGGLFDTHNSNSQEITLNREPFVFSQQLGIAFTSRRFVIDAAAIFHSIDVKEMRQSHQWGSVTALYRFK